MANTKTPNRFTVKPWHSPSLSYVCEMTKKKYVWCFSIVLICVALRFCDTFLSLDAGCTSVSIRLHHQDRSTFVYIFRLTLSHAGTSLFWQLGFLPHRTKKKKFNRQTEPSMEMLILEPTNADKTVTPFRSPSWCLEVFRFFFRHTKT